MSDNDTSDKALNEWWDKSRKSKYPCNAANAAWQECRRRAEAQLKACRESFDKAYADAHNWQSENNELLAQMEERERKAFIAGYYHPGTPDFEDAYREFKEGKCE